LCAVYSAVVQTGVIIGTTPDDHFIAGPDCRAVSSPTRCVVRANRCPTIRAGIVSAAAGVIKSAPDDHFATRPDRYVTR
jgi:hypothetical protein